MVAETVMNLLGENPSPYVLTFAVFMLCCIMTNFMSNTATTALLVPICVSIAQGMGADPRAVLMACVIGGSCALSLIHIFIVIFLSNGKCFLLLKLFINKF